MVVPFGDREGHGTRLDSARPVIARLRVRRLDRQDDVGVAAVDGVLDEASPALATEFLFDEGHGLRAGLAPLEPEAAPHRLVWRDHPLGRNVKFRRAVGAWFEDPVHGTGREPTLRLADDD